MLRGPGSADQGVHGRDGALDAPVCFPDTGTQEELMSRGTGVRTDPTRAARPDSVDLKLESHPNDPTPAHA